jgi:threonine/homoserine/homoserine lactone efflux protein
MEINIPLASVLGLLSSMLILAMLPSVSVSTVSARSASGGFIHGVATTIGIIAGDLFYILLAIFGLALLSEAMGESAYLIKYAGGAYMIWIGIRLWRAGSKPISAERQVNASSLVSSFMTGLLLTLADQKVVMFYLGFLPAFINLAEISYLDAAIVMATTIVAVGSVKLAYAFIAHKAGTVFGPKASTMLNRSASGVMVGVGLYLFSKQ